MEDSNSLDLTEGLEDRVHVPFVYTRDHAEWLTADGQANFARGTEARVDQAQEETYAAMAMKDTLSSPFGLDSACPTLGLSDVRAQPPMLRQSKVTRLRVVRHLTLVRALPVRNSCLLPSLCRGVKSPNYEG